MSTKREQIVAAVKTLMTNIAGVNNADIYRSREAALSRGNVPAIIVRWLSDQPTNIVIPKLDWNLQVRISVITRGSVPDQIADPIVSDIHSKLTADLSLGGLCMDIQPGNVQNNIEDADQPHCEIFMDYTLIYRTTVADLTQ